MVRILNFRLRKGPGLAKLEYFEKQVGFEGVPLFLLRLAYGFGAWVWGLGFGVSSSALEKLPKSK